MNETPGEVVFLFDVDNTLLDNDRIETDLRRHLESEFGAEARNRYFAVFEGLRAELGYADYLGALQRYRLENLCDVRLLMMSSFLVDYPFANRLYPGSLDALDFQATPMYPPADIAIDHIGDLVNYDLRAFTSPRKP